MEWIFDPLPPSGARNGGLPQDYVFEQNVDTFVREVLQNAHDQRLESSACSEVDFDLIQLTGQRKASFLEALQWRVLAGHLSGIAEGSSPTAVRIARELEEVDSRPLRLLRIVDRNTRGLVGGEDEDGENFQALCRNVLDTSESNPDRGGSHGLGKAVLWAFSGVSTVLFHSTVGEGQDKGRSRFFAKAEFPSHDDASGTPWNGPGWLGVRDEGRMRAVSCWDRDALDAAAQLELKRNDEPGTSILIVDLDEPLSDEDRPLEELASEISASASRWFWPAMLKGTLAVRIRVLHDEITVVDETARLTDEVRPFAAALEEGEPVSDVRAPGAVAERVVTVGIPARKAVGGAARESETEASATLRIRSAGGDSEELFENCVALIRGAGMVVQYWKSPRHRNVEQSFHAVLLAGMAGGESEAHRAADRFLRACEPPAHDEWKASTRRQRELYEAGGSTRIKRLEGDVQSAIDSALFATPPSGAQGPDLLRKLFPVGGGSGGGAGSEHRFATSVQSGELVDGVWTVLADLFHRKGDGLWTARLELALDADSGRGTRLEITEASVEGEGSASVELNEGRALVAVDGDARVTVRLRSDTADKALSSRTRLRLDARFKPGEVFA